jgi:hypothetical protein
LHRCMPQEVAAAAIAQKHRERQQQLERQAVAERQRVEREAAAVAQAEVLRIGREAAAAAKEQQQHERQAVDREAAEAAAELLRKERQVYIHHLPSATGVQQAEMRLHGTPSPRALPVSAAATCVEGGRAVYLFRHNSWWGVEGGHTQQRIRSEQDASEATVAAVVERLRVQREAAEAAKWAIEEAEEERLAAEQAQREAHEAAKRETEQAEEKRLAGEQAQREARVAHEEAKAVAKRDQMMEAKRLKKAANEAAKQQRLERQAAAAAERQRVTLAPYSSLSGNNNLYPSSPSFRCAESRAGVAVE